jgi:hypothetical protein
MPKFFECTIDDYPNVIRLDMICRVAIHHNATLVFTENWTFPLYGEDRDRFRTAFEEFMKESTSTDYQILENAMIIYGNLVEQAEKSGQSGGPGGSNKPG